MRFWLRLGLVLRIGALRAFFHGEVTPGQQLSDLALSSLLVLKPQLDKRLLVLVAHTVPSLSL